MAREPVRLNVYDMYWINDYLTSMGVGVFHSGVEIYGVEYAYGGHPFSFSGVFENSPKDAEELGDNFKFKQSILLGYTDFSNTDVTGLISNLGKEYYEKKRMIDAYARIHNLIVFWSNQWTILSFIICTFFSVPFRSLETLCGADVPGWVNRLAYISGSIPLLERCLPKEWLTPVALQQAVDEQNQQRGLDGILRESASQSVIMNGRGDNSHHHPHGAQQSSSSNLSSPSKDMARSGSGNSVSNFIANLRSNYNNSSKGQNGSSSFGSSPSLGGSSGSSPTSTTINAATGTTTELLAQSHPHHNNINSSSTTSNGTTSSNITKNKAI